MKSKVSAKLFHLGHRLLSLARPEECLKNMVKPETIPLDYWKNILWVAKDLKIEVKENEKKCLNLLPTKHVTLLFTKPHGRFQLAFTLACDLLGVRRTMYCDPHFESQPYPGDGSRVLSTLTDMLVIHGVHHSALVKMVADAAVPVFSASCDVYCFQKALSDLMTCQETLRKLKNVQLAWIGPPNSLFNSYLILCAKFGIHVRYTCICSFGAGRMSPVHRFPDALMDNEIQLKEFKTATETVRGANVVVTSMHPEEKNKITLELLKNADPGWVFMHSLPRGSVEVSDEVFNHESNLSWKTSENYLYVAMAVILTSLKEHRPKTPIPDFDGASAPL